MDKIKLILVDDHEIFLAGLRMKLAAYSDSVEVIAEATDFRGLMVHLDNGLRPDVLILDYHLPDKDGIGIARLLKYHDDYKSIKIIILSAYSSQYMNEHNYDLIREAVDAGVDGYLLKDSAIEEIVLAVNKAMIDEVFILGETINIHELNKEIIEDRRRLRGFLKKHDNYSLTGKEIEILQMTAQGHSSKAIASLLKITEEAVTNHKDNIKMKLKEKYDIDFKNIVELVVWAIRNRIVKV